jgi:hypothetical protein
MPESAIIAVEARQGAYDYAKEKMLVWWILLISIKAPLLPTHNQMC